jgi:hypothetical protein
MLSNKGEGEGEQWAWLGQESFNPEGKDFN